MPARKPSTERQRRLGAELRKMREHIGMTINEAATLHRTDRTTVSNTESARSGVSSDRVRVFGRPTTAVLTRSTSTPWPR
ncbi:helix-turn-helix domain-containing protein [Streptomyces sp. SA15]|uniref:helix-turn-helix domain-containing protein n=1 Tax=Streptomyces sp. SA15 TaxID=934019 RepID=UPI00268CBB7C|nr:helix-turn-helix domain-containing protein [Streptomyces sp. SA15]